MLYYDGKGRTFLIKILKIFSENFTETVDKINKTEYTIIEHLNNASNDKVIMINKTEKNSEPINSIRNRLPDDETVYALAELFKALGDPTRAKILGVLQIKDLYVGEIAEILQMTTSAVSHQLRVLRAIKLVKGKKEGKEVKYSLDDDHVAEIMMCGLTHVNEE